ncbi:MAG: TetR/AcrR family transcriptional regulator [Spirochaetaceae bacterium]|nr:TetR/AcrR family transcriptional regulator [Spirochaetaceae bacterium]
MSQKSNAPSRQVRRTRSWIFDALMLLMEEKPWHKITVSGITQKAGIARQTFYRNYGSKEDIAIEYLTNTMHTSLLKIEQAAPKNGRNTIVFDFNYAYMLKHRDRLKKILSVPQIENYIFGETQKLPFELLEQYRDSLSPDEYLTARYTLCYGITGMLRSFLDWFMNDMPLPVRRMIPLLNAMAVHNTETFRNIPHIQIHIHEGP